MASCDSAYKYLFSNPAILCKLIHAFVEEDFSTKIQPDSLRKLDPSHLSATLQQRESDLLYEVRLDSQDNQDNQTAYLYILLEFQSTAPKHMAIRLLSYISLFYERLIKEGKNSKGKLPPVFPDEPGLEITIFRRWIALLFGEGMNESEYNQITAAEEVQRMLATLADDLRAEGRQEGREEGREEGRQETAKNLLEMHISIKQIARQPDSAKRKSGSCNETGYVHAASNGEAWKNGKARAQQGPTFPLSKSLLPLLTVVNGTSKQAVCHKPCHKAEPLLREKDRVWLSIFLWWGVFRDPL